MYCCIDKMYNFLKAVAPTISRMNPSNLEDEAMSVEESSPALTTSRKKSRAEDEAMSLEGNSPARTTSWKKSRSEGNAIKVTFNADSPAPTKLKKKAQSDDKRSRLTKSLKKARSEVTNKWLSFALK